MTFGKNGGMPKIQPRDAILSWADFKKIKPKPELRSLTPSLSDNISQPHRQPSPPLEIPQQKEEEKPPPPPVEVPVINLKKPEEVAVPLPKPVSSPAVQPKKRTFTQEAIKNLGYHKSIVNKLKDMPASDFQKVLFDDSDTWTPEYKCTAKAMALISDEEGLRYSDIDTSNPKGRLYKKVIRRKKSFLRSDQLQRSIRQKVKEQNEKSLVEEKKQQ